MRVLSRLRQRRLQKAADAEALLARWLTMGLPAGQITRVQVPAGQEAEHG